MVERDESIIKKTVHFDRPITGSDLVAAVRSACDEPAQPGEYGGRRFYEDRRDNDAAPHRIGQTSLHPDQHLLVAPSDTEEFIRPEQFYDSVVVSTHRHPGSAWAVGGRPEHQLAAVEEFTERLSRHLPDGLQGNSGRSRDPYAPARGATASLPDTTGKPGAYRNDSGPSAGPRGY